MKLTALIVDDEPLGRERVRSLLADEPDIEILAECASATAALAAMRGTQPDILFLDVQMPEIDGFELLRRLGSPLPLVIFVTAFDEHAVAAFEVHALDYLLKPIKPERFQHALRRARAQLAEQNGEGRARHLLALLESHRSETPFLSRLAVRDRDRTRFVKVTDIDWVEASGNYIVIHSGKEKHVLRETLAAIEVQLSPQEFFRLNRSALVRLDRIREIEPTFNEDHVVVLANNLRLPLTRSVRDLQERLRFA